MHRVFPVFLACILLFSCASSQVRRVVTEEEKVSALREALRQAAAQVADKDKPQATEEDAVGAESEMIAGHTEIPLIGRRIQSTVDAATAFARDAVAEAGAFVMEKAEEIPIPSADTLIDSSDDSMSQIFDAAWGDELEAVLNRDLADDLKAFTTASSLITRAWETWNHGLKSVGRDELPAIKLRTADELVHIFRQRYVSRLREEEIDVRTTPRPLGTGSLYEFFSRTVKNAP